MKIKFHFATNETFARDVSIKVNSLKLGQSVDDDSNPNTGMSLC